MLELYQMEYNYILIYITDAYNPRQQSHRFSTVVYINKTKPLSTVVY